MIPHAVVGLVAALAISLLALRARALTPRGAAGASLVGALIFTAGGLAWSALLLLFFLPSSALSRLPGGATPGLLEKSDRRDAAQVLANGGMAAAAALLYLLHPASSLIAAFGGALAAASSDTWASELGSRFGGTPRLLTTGRRVSPGTSGAVSAVGLLASILGAGIIAGGAAIALPPGSAFPTFIGGIAGSVSDTLLGATVQNRRYCPLCGVSTEQRVHSRCHTPTRSAGGIPWLDNDGVNLAATVAGGLVAALSRSPF